MDVNNISMLCHSLVVNHFKIMNPYVIGLLSSLIMYILTKINNESMPWFSKKLNFINGTNYIIVNKTTGHGYDNGYDNKIYSSTSWYITKNVQTRIKYGLYCKHNTPNKDELSIYTDIDKPVDITFNGNLLRIEYTIDTYIVSSKNISSTQIMNILDKIYNEYILSNQDNSILLYNINSKRAEYNNPSWWERQKFETCKTWDTIFLDAKHKIELQTDISKFLLSKKLYEDKGQPFSRGYFLHGHPGCGKSSVVKSIIKEFNKDAYILNMSLIHSDQDFFSCIKEIKHGSIIVMEDIDCVPECLSREIKDKVKNKDKDKEQDNNIQGVHLNSILNFIDGVEENSYIFIMTTNYKDKLDDALIRPGRFDYSLELTLCSYSMFLEIFQFYCDKSYQEYIDKNPEYKDFKFPEYKISPAYLINICFKYRENIPRIFTEIKSKK